MAVQTPSFQLVVFEVEAVRRECFSRKPQWNNGKKDSKKVRADIGRATKKGTQGKRKYILADPGMALRLVNEILFLPLTPKRNLG